ncbi:uncharacterized protein LOC119081203 [Bradysia coprophila]|uniref:uncharacterized protein LOC119081203 n=1 Tax=Bradysia coprophila TaxID=38358 RepID=UPI00187D7A66|nr:uncharacterized protein LOC119081203 [Bradysia coprophila]
MTPKVFEGVGVMPQVPHGAVQLPPASPTVQDESESDDSDEELLVSRIMPWYRHKYFYRFLVPPTVTRNFIKMFMRPASLDIVTGLRILTYAGTRATTLTLHGYREVIMEYLLANGDYFRHRNGRQNGEMQFLTDNEGAGIIIGAGGAGIRALRDRNICIHVARRFLPRSRERIVGIRGGRVDACETLFRNLESGCAREQWHIPSGWDGEFSINWTEGEPA